MLLERGIWLLKSMLVVGEHFSAVSWLLERMLAE